MTDIRNGTCPHCRDNEIVEAVPLEVGGNQYETTSAVIEGPPSTGPLR